MLGAESSASGAAGGRVPAEHAEPPRVLWPRKGAGRAPPQRAVLWECERSAWQCGLGAVAWLYGGCSPVELRRGAEQVRQTQARWREAPADDSIKR